MSLPGALVLVAVLATGCSTASGSAGQTPAATPDAVGTASGPTPTPAPSTPPTPTASPLGAPTPMTPDEAVDVLAAQEADWPARVDLATFDSDSHAPLEVEELARTEQGDTTIRELTYAGPDGAVVPALVAEPGDSTGHAMVMVPGLPEHKEAYVQAISEFACAGLTAIVVDPPWTREEGRGGALALSFTASDRDEQVQLIRDVRRAIDLLEAEYDVDHVGYTAISYGATIGLQVAAVEPRIDAFALLSVDGGLVDHFTYDGNPIGDLAMAPPEAQQAWIEALAPIEPIRFLDEATAPILFLQGRQDNVTPPTKAQVVHGVADDVADVRWYDAGHGLEPQAFRDMFTWWAEEFDLDRDRVAACPAGE